MNSDLYLYDLKTKFDKIDKSKYYLSYSGGKDSHFLYWFIKEYLKDTEIQIVGCNTYLEHDEIKDRIYKYSDRVLLPKLKPHEIKEKYGIPCFSKQQDQFIYYFQKGTTSPSTLARFYGTDTKSWHNVSKKAREYVLSDNAHKITHLCCKYLKKDPFHRYEKETSKKAILGVRAGESKMRSSQYKSCFTKDMKFTPIHDLTDDILNNIYKEYKIEIPKIYEKVSRTGCIGCPYGSYKHETEEDLKVISGTKKEYIIDLFKESYEILGINLK